MTLALTAFDRLCAKKSTAHFKNLQQFDQSPGKMGGQTRPFTHCKLHEVQRRIWEVAHYPTINSVGLLVRMLSIFPWLVRVVSDRSVRYNGKHRWSSHSFNKKNPTNQYAFLRHLHARSHLAFLFFFLSQHVTDEKINQRIIK